MELIEDCRKILKQIEDELECIEPYVTYGGSYDYRELIKHAENLAVRVRELGTKVLPCEYLNEYDRVKDEIIVECSNITWTYINKDHFVLHMPALLKKNKFASREFLRGEILNVLYDLMDEEDVSVGPDRYVVFNHLINSHKRRYVLDYDNMDISTVINCLAETIIGNDSPFYYNLMHEGTIVDDEDFENRVDVHVMSRGEFLQFIEEKYRD